MDNDVFPIALIAALELVALVFAVGRWRGRGGVVSKLVWTGVLVAPVFGLTAFAVWHETPPPSDPIDRPPDRDWDLPPPPGT